MAALNRWWYESKGIWRFQGRQHIASVPPETAQWAKSAPVGIGGVGSWPRRWLRRASAQNHPDRHGRDILHLPAPVAWIRAVQGTVWPILKTEVMAERIRAVNRDQR